MLGMGLGTLYLLDTLAIFTGYVLDLLSGDPAGRFHPVCMIGRLITALEKRLYREEDPEGRKYAKGILLVITVITATAFVTTLILAACAWIKGRPGQILYLAAAALLCGAELAVRDLRKESMAVAAALEQDLKAARHALSRIVGRDTQDLDEAGVIRAAVETVAENTTDGVVSPLFYMLLGGPVAAMVYKAVNTMDSMVGYRNDRYLQYGRAAARLDDAVNFIPARLAALGWILSAGLCGADMHGAYRIWKRDRRKHESPNSAQTESACAGALGVCLAGDASYFGKVKKKPVIGDPVREIRREDIGRANRMMSVVSILATALAVLLRLGIWRLIFG